MARWIEKRLEPGEKVLVTFKASWRKAAILALIITLLMFALFILIWLYIGDEIVDPKWIVEGAFVLIGLAIMNAFSRTVVTNRRVIHRVRHLFVTHTESIWHKDILALSLTPWLGADHITITHAIGRKFVIATIDQPANFLSALLSAYPFKNLKVSGAPTSTWANVIGSVLVVATLVAALFLAVECGMMIWSIIESVQTDSAAIKFLLAALLVLIPIVGFAAGAVLAHLALIALFTRFFSSDDLRQVINMGATLEGTGSMARYSRWSLAMNQRYAQWLYGRPVDLTPPTTTVSSPT